MEEVHKIDPDGDTIPVLRNPGAPFAVWEDILDSPEPTSAKGKGTYDPIVERRSPLEMSRLLEKDPEERSNEERKILRRWKRMMRARKKEQPRADCAANPAPASPLPEPGPSTPHDSTFGNEESEMSAASSPAHSNSAVSQDEYQSDTSMADDASEEELSSAEDCEVQFLVSSRHLALASDFFKNSLAKNGWKEGEPSEADGLYHLTTEDWDADALLILLNVLHHRNYQVPRAITLGMLARIAVLVDYYHCAEAVDMFPRVWINETKKIFPVPSTYDRNLVLWLFVAWFFKLPEEFEATTKIVLRQNTAPTVQDMSLPIPEVVLDALKYRRYQVIESLIARLHEWLDKFRTGDYCCSREEYRFSCSSILFGALTKEMDRMGRLSPRPSAPFQGFSFDALCSEVSAMRSPTWIDSRHGGYFDGDEHPCSFHETVERGINEIKFQVTGLELCIFHDRIEDK